MKFLVFQLKPNRIDFDSMKNIFKKVREPFVTELSTDGDIWRILRKGTLVDLIKLSFFYFQRDKNEKHLIDMFNHAMKIKLLSRIKAIEVIGSLDEVSKKFNREPEFILKQYDNVFNELQPAFKNYSSSNLYDLNEKIRYIKVLNELEIDSYVDDIFEEIIGITFNILNDE
jgi:hypothetical protein